MKLRSLFHLLLLTLFLSVPLNAAVVADPWQLEGYSEWGYVPLGETRTATILLKNEGTEAAEVTAIDLDYSIPRGFPSKPSRSLTRCSREEKPPSKSSSHPSASV